MPVREHASVVERRFGDLFARGDFDAANDLVAPDFVAYGAGGDGRIHETHGPGAFREWLRWYLSAFVAGEWTVHDVISEDDKVVARYSGRTARHPFRGPARPETGSLIYRVEDGLMRETWSEMSDLRVVMQLGAFPAPERDEDR